MKTLKQWVLPSLLILAVLGCQAKNAPLTNPPEKIGDGAAHGGQLSFNFNPKVDILFVIDDSRSMLDEQTTLRNNIHAFVNEFAKFELIDFHIAVTRVSDFTPRSVMARERAVRLCSEAKAGANGKKFVATGGITADCDFVKGNQVPRGTLVTLKGMDKGKQVEFPDLPRFITRQTPDYLTVLKSTLDVGTQFVEYGGSEFEEILHPMVGVFSNSAAAGTNKGFFRQDAAILAVFILTDADDIEGYPDSGKGSDGADYPEKTKPRISAQEAAALLKGLKANKGKLLTFAGLSMGQSCSEKDPVLSRVPENKSQLPHVMMDFINRTDGRQFDICSGNWGAQLASFGKQIRKELATKGFLLHDIPEAGTLQVFYGDPRARSAQDEIAQYDKNGNQVWGYKIDPNGKNPRIRFTEHADFKAKPGASFYAEYKKLSATKVRNGKMPFAGAH